MLRTIDIYFGQHIPITSLLKREVPSESTSDNAKIESLIPRPIDRDSAGIWRLGEVVRALLTVEYRALCSSEAQPPVLQITFGPIFWLNRCNAPRSLSLCRHCARNPRSHLEHPIIINRTVLKAIHHSNNKCNKQRGD